MGKTFDLLSPELQSWLSQQRMFFVATAPLSHEGHINCSPKGLDTFRVLDEHRVAYVDLTGSGIETVAHVQENGRIVLMFCAFEGPPRIVRLHGKGRALYPPDAAFDGLAARFPGYAAARAIIEVAVTRIADSCGFGVPLLRFVGERDLLEKWAKGKGAGGLEQYRREKNRRSIDGRPGFDAPGEPPGPAPASGATPAGPRAPLGSRGTPGG
jgi:hypothetical protein